MVFPTRRHNTAHHLLTFTLGVTVGTSFTLLFFVMREPLGRCETSSQYFAAAMHIRAQPAVEGLSRTDRTYTLDAGGEVLYDEGYDAESLPSPVPMEEIVSDEPWEFFNDRKIYNGLMTQPRYSLKLHSAVRKDLAVVRAELARAASRQFKQSMVVASVSDSYLRRNSVKGTEYVYDVQLRENGSSLPAVNARIEVTREFMPKLSTTIITYEETETVNFIVPIMNVELRLKEFMWMYEKQFLKTHEKVCLILVVYGKASIAYVRKIQQSVLRSYQSAKIVILPQTEGTFSRSNALDIGMALLNGSDLAFFCDVDLKIHHAFTQRCRRNTIRSQRVYFPEVFKMYNLHFVYRHRRMPRNPYVATRTHGHWGSYGFGMACIYKSDYVDVGGFNTRITGWGGEDVDFFMRVKRKLSAMQAPDTALWHRWHPKVCSTKLSRDQYNSCLGSKFESLADKKELAGLIYEHKIKP